MNKNRCAIFRYVKRVITLLAFVTIIISSRISAQTPFYKTISFPDQIDFGHALMTNDGGYMITANGPAALQYAVKTDSLGDTLWTKLYSSLWGYSNVIQTNDGGYLFTSNHGLIKTSSTGFILWSKYNSTGHTGPIIIRQTNDGGYITSGGLLDRYLGKLDALGNYTWNKFYHVYWTNGGGQGHIEDVRQTFDGGYIIAGSTYIFGAGGEDFCLTKTDASGNVLWSKTYGGASNEMAQYVQQTSDGGYILGGMSQSFGAGDWDFYVVRTDTAGNLLWSKTYGGNQTDQVSSIQQTVDGGFIISGPSLSFPGGSLNKICLIKADATGSVVWSNAYMYNANNERADAIQTSDGGYMTFSSSSGCCPGVLIMMKTDSVGNNGCYQYQAPVIETVPPTQVNSVSDTVFDMADTMINMSVTVSSGATLPPPCLSTGIQSGIAPSQSAISLYPNPAREQLIVVSEVRKIERIEIYDLPGEKCFIPSDPKGESMYIDVSSLAQGIYFVKVYLENAEQVMKFVKD